MRSKDKKRTGTAKRSKYGNKDIINVKSKIPESHHESHKKDLSGNFQKNLTRESVCGINEVEHNVLC